MKTEEIEKTISVDVYKCEACGTVFEDRHECYCHEKKCQEWSRGKPALKVGDCVKHENYQFYKITKVEKSEKDKCFYYSATRVSGDTSDDQQKTKIVMTIDAVHFSFDGALVDDAIKQSLAWKKKLLKEVGEKDNAEVLFYIEGSLKNDGDIEVGIQISFQVKSRDTCED